MRTSLTTILRIDAAGEGFSPLPSASCATKFPPFRRKYDTKSLTEGEARIKERQRRRWGMELYTWGISSWTVTRGIALEQKQVAAGRWWRKKAGSKGREGGGRT